MENLETTRPGLLRSGLVFLLLLLVLQIDAQPVLTKLHRGECKTPCEAPQRVFEQQLKKDVLSFGFGLLKTCNDGDTLTLSLHSDTLVIQTLSKKKRVLRQRNGRMDSVYENNEYECDCFYRYDVAIKGLGKKPPVIMVNNKLHHETYGFLGLRSSNKMISFFGSDSIQRAFARGREFYMSEARGALRSKESMSNYLHYNASLKIELRIGVTQTEANEPGLQERAARQADDLIMSLYRKKDLCPARFEYKGIKVMSGEELQAMPEGQRKSGSYWITLRETKSSVFPGYKAKGK